MNPLTSVSTTLGNYITYFLLCLCDDIPIILYSAKLENLTKTENEVLHRIQQLENSATSRKNDIQRINTLLHRTEKDIGNFIQTAHSTSVRTVHNYTAHTSNYISSSLQAQRGYTVKPNTTPGHIVNSTARVSTRNRSFLITKFYSFDQFLCKPIKRIEDRG